MKPFDYAAICVDTYDGEHGSVSLPYGFIRTNTIIIRHSNLCIYENETDLVLAFQGSNGEKDWKDNFFFLPVFNGKIHDGYHKNEAIFIHAGFKRNYAPLRPTIMEIIKNTAKTISICGHSLGGALAMLCLYDIRSSSLKPDTFTFGAPRVGNKAFYDSVEHFNVYHFKNNNDLVTNVPFKIFGYHEPDREQISDGKSEWKGWTPFGNWKDHYPMKYYKAMVNY